MSGLEQLGNALEERVISVKYLPWQMDVRRHVLEKGVRTVLLACGARSGKDVLCSRLAVEMAFRLALERQGKPTNYSKVPLVSVVVVAPKRELYSQSKAEIMSLIPSEIRRTNRYYDWIQVAGDIVFKFKTLHDGPEQLVGDAIDILIFTEASRTPPSSTAFEQSLCPRLYSPGCYGLAMLNGTPRCGPEHWYRNLYDRIEEGRVINAKAWRLPTYVANPMMADPKVLMAIRSQMTEQNYSCEIEAQWPNETVRVLNPQILHESTLEDTRNLRFTKFSIGVDPARTTDATAIAVLGYSPEVGLVLVYAEWLQNMNVLMQMERIAQVWKTFRYSHIVCDATAFGGKTYYDLLVEMTGSEKYVSKFDFGQRTKGEIITSLVSAYESRRLKFALDRLKHDALRRIEGEFAEFDVSFNEKGLPEYGGPHDDMVMAIALALKGIEGYVAQRRAREAKAIQEINPRMKTRLEDIISRIRGLR